MTTVYTRRMRAKAPPALEDCYFYQSIDLPGESFAGCWDLRENTPAYLGNVDLRGKRVLELGAANGYLTFWMERQGADVIPVDLSPEKLGDILPVPGRDLEAFSAGYRRVVAGLNNAWWYARDRLGSHRVLRHASVYSLPDSIEEVDVATFGSILLHLRDPFSALAEAARRVRETIVVTDTLDPPFTKDGTEDFMRFNPTSNARLCTWWFLSPGAVRQMLIALGFTRFAVSYHEQVFRPGFTPWGLTRPEDYTGPRSTGTLFTVVATRG